MILMSKIQHYIWNITFKINKSKYSNFNSIIIFTLLKLNMLINYSS